MTPQPSSLLAALRQSTRADHERLESLTYGAKIMDGSLTAAEYRRLLEWQRRAHAVLEPQIAGFQRNGYAYRPRFDVPQKPGAKTADLPRALGILYVLEGGSLGGSVILRKLHANAALESEAPFTFYQQQAEWGVAQWRAFTKMLSTISLSSDDMQRAVAGARDAFGRFEAEWRAMP